MRKLRILLSLMGLEIGGAETHAVELAKSLKNNGYLVYVVSSGGVYEKELEENNIPHFYAPLTSKSPLNMLKSYNTIKKIVVKEKIDLDFKEKNIDFDIEYYKNIKEELKRNLNTFGWDGRWFKRAINDDNIWIGSIDSKECKIDGLVQSWAVISDAADNDKKYIAMEEAENYLVDKENGIIKLFTPAFKYVDFNPGYIKAYPEGIRENGGQYTHAAIWFCLAKLKLGFYDEAFELLEMINPITHSESYEKMNKFIL